MITHEAFQPEPWGLRERALDLAILAQTESLFTLSNGHIGLRGNLDEADPQVFPGTYLNAFYDLRPLPYPEGGYGYPEADQTVVNVTDGKIIRLLIDDENFDVRYGRLLEHERFLDFREGVLQRRLRWRSPAGRTVRLSATRIVSLTHRSVAAVLYEVEPLDGPARVVVQSELVANEPIAAPTVGDPRAASQLDTHLLQEHAWQDGRKVVLVHRTRASGLRLAAAMDHLIEGPGRATVSTEASEDRGRVTISTELEPGSSLRMVKLLAYGWSAERSISTLHDQVDAALAAARFSGWDGLLREQKAYLDRFWAGADVEIDGDPELQQAVRFGLFHVFQAAARAEERGIAAKGLTGPGYDGHTFWDAETFVLPVLTYCAPECAASELRWRHAIVPLARARARLLGLGGVTFPWRTIHGEECSGYWPAGTAAFHVNADVADAVVRYASAAEDSAFEREYGLEILVETARLWSSLGHFSKGRFRIDGVTGPNEYSALADNNVYTNLMARRNLRAAIAAVARHPDRAAELEVDPEECRRWRSAADAMVVPFDSDLGVHEQSEGFTGHEVWDFASTPPDKYPLMLHFPYFDIYRKQVVKQADLVLALHLCGDAFTIDQKLRDFDYYEPLTVRDSSLSACTQAVVAAEVGHLDLAYDYFGETALIDLNDVEHNVRDGLHLAALAGGWIAAVAGFGGMRDHDGRLSFAPRLPPQISRLAFNLNFRGRRLKVEIRPRDVENSLLAGEPLEILQGSRRLTLMRGGSQRRRLQKVPVLPSPVQPRGRTPLRRRKD